VNAPAIIHFDGCLSLCLSRIKIDLFWEKVSRNKGVLCAFQPLSLLQSICILSHKPHHRTTLYTLFSTVQNDTVLQNVTILHQCLSKYAMLLCGTKRTVKTIFSYTLVIDYKLFDIMKSLETFYW